MFVVLRGPQCLLDGETLRTMELDCLSFVTGTRTGDNGNTAVLPFSCHRPSVRAGSYGMTEAPPENRPWHHW